MSKKSFKFKNHAIFLRSAAPPGVGSTATGDFCVVRL